MNGEKGIPTEGSEEFFRNLEEQMEGAAPGLSERLERLKFEQLGRAIIVKKDPQADRIARAEKIIANIQGKDVSDPEERTQQNKDFLAGYILPVREDQEKHVVILRNGSILVIQLRASSGSALEKEALKENYKELFSPNTEPLELTHSWGGVDRVESTWLPIHSKIALSSKNLQDLPQISEAVSQSLSLAKELKVTREKAKQEGLQNFTKQLDSFFGKDKPDILPPDQNFPPPQSLNPGSS